MASGSSSIPWARRAELFRVHWQESVEDGSVNILACTLSSSGPWELPLTLAKFARTCLTLHALFTLRILRQLAACCSRTLGWIPPPRALLRLRNAPEVGPVAPPPEQVALQELARIREQYSDSDSDSL